MPTIAEVKQPVDRIRVASFQTDLTAPLADHLRRHALVGVQAALETALVEEREAQRQRTPALVCHRSGTYTRRVLTTHGFMPDLHVPKLRADNRARVWQVRTRYQLSMPLLRDPAW